MTKAKIFLDTNVILDLLGERIPFYTSIARIATLADKGQIIIAASALSYATVNYILTKYENPKIAREKLRNFKIISEISELNELIIEKGLNSKFTDFEDSLQYYSAIESGCQIIISRNGKDFKESQIPIMTADEFLKSLKSKN